ncbi:hypothetical protein [Streptomyces sp. NPDC020681]|uniref:hypothetical protein n=1 Tax=Streptomyces sp. NPDC020681 TaxID=3365083 RepID=UPI00379C0D56
MNSTGRRITAVATSAAAISAGLLALPSTASAAPTGSCGSSYAKIDSYQVTRDWAKPYVGGRIDLYYSAATGKNCAITRPASGFAGKASRITVCLENADKNVAVQCDGIDKNYRYYAGPVYLYAPGDCINVRGGVTLPDRGSYVGGAFKVHCG